MINNIIIGLAMQTLIIASICLPIRKKEVKSSYFDKDFTKNLKAVSCVIVMISHMGLPISYGLIGMIHWVAVTFFFFFSGYGLTLSKESNPLYVKKLYMRIIKISIPYVIILLLAQYIPFIHMGSGGMYFMNVIILFYFIYYIIHNLKPERADFIVCILIILYSVLIQKYNDSRMQTSSGLIHYLGWGSQSMGFVWGIIIARYKEKIISSIMKKQKWILILGGLVLIILGSTYLNIHDILQVSWSMYFLRIIFSAICIIFLMIVSINFNIGNRFSHILGSISYFIFLIHGSVIEELKVLSLNNSLYLILTIVLTIAISLIYAGGIKTIYFIGDKFVKRK